MLKTSIPIRDKHMVEVSTSHDGSPELKFMAKPTPDSDWQFTGGLLLCPRTAAALALTLLEKAGKSDMLMKKFRPEP